MNRSAAPNDTDDAAIHRTVELLRQAEHVRASDVHLQMQPEGAAEVAFRIDGLLVQREALPAGLAERVFGRIKFLSRLKTYQESLPQDGRMNKADLGIAHDVRVATYPTVIGERIVLRLFSRDGAKPLAELGLDPAAHEALTGFLRQPGGLLLLTGPAGSGKTTTIYACLLELARQGGRHIVTVEDPVEQILPGITQTEVSEARGLTYAAAARHLLRQDPQVLVIGEIRDEETARIAVRAGLTGHLVIATLHAGSCRGVVDRLLTLCPDVSAVNAAVRMVVNQRLLRRICRACSGQGCASCAGSGSHGRLPVVEWWRGNGNADLSALQPSRSLRASARALVEVGEVSEAELLRALGADETE